MNNIRKYRKEREYQLQELAKKVGVSTSYMCLLEKGIRSNPSYAIMKKIAKELNKSIQEIFEN